MQRSFLMCVLAIMTSVSVASAQVCEIVASETLLPIDQETIGKFGSSISISGDFLVVGSRQVQFSDTDPAGAAYIFKRVGDGWELMQEISSPYNLFNTYFGSIAAISDDVLAISAGGDQPHGTNSGSVFVFRLRNDIWEFEEKLTASNGGIGEFFGAAIAVEGNTIVVGVPSSDSYLPNRGAVYVYEFDGAQWNETGWLHREGQGRLNEYFGASVDIHDGLIAVGFPGYQEQIHTTIGAISLYSKVGSVWGRTGFYTGIADELMQLGSEIILDSNRLISVTESGFVQVYRNQNGIFIPDSVVPWHAETVAIDGDYIALGNRWAGGHGYGASRFYKYNDGQWDVIAEISSGLSVNNGFFGSALAIQDGQLYIGTFGLEQVYIESEPALCASDLYRDCVLDFFDVSAFLQLFATQDPAGDLTGDGIWDFFDVSAFLAAFAAGCP